MPLACRIHEGAVFSNRDHRTLLDKMILLLDSLGMKEPCYFVADAYYAAGNSVRGLLARGNHLVTRVKSNSVAFFPATPPPSHRTRGRGRPAKYSTAEQRRSPPGRIRSPPEFTRSRSITPVTRHT